SLPAFDVDEVLGGTFQMGAWGKTLDGAWDNEKPAHQVTVSTFWMGRFEVTQALWQAVMGNNPSNWKGDNLPVEYVSWGDCQTFLQRLNNRKGELGLQGSMYFDLPTEAEWEFAARGGRNSGNYTYSGSDNLDYVAWHYGNSGRRTHPVGQKAKNELGLYDMTGNVWEWCKDWYGSYPSYAQTNPTGPSSGSDRVYRGGCWFSIARVSHVSCRGSHAPDGRSSDLGLRLVLKFP
ncbi:MAG: formylglycine-generating enzyme family protein, partial [Bacteroidaceae bacterium]|nr:formylglycine-generating enzyme family protein [Bacteroidaceae bacterium]